jgi:hypothetical protein
LLSFIKSARHNQAARIFNIDVLTALIAMLLPWTTTGVAIVATLWLVALLPSIEIRPLLRSLARPISILPIALFALAAGEHVQVRHLRPSVPTLEDVFAHAVGEE